MCTHPFSNAGRSIHNSTAYLTHILKHTPSSTLSHNPVNMVKYALIAFAGLAAALPLNINLGAYSPALVVGTSPLPSPSTPPTSTNNPPGDGEISFGGEQDVSQLMNALEGAAVNAASSSAPSSEAQPAARPPAAGVESAAADPALAQQAQQIAALQGMGKQVVAHPRVQPSKRDLAGFDRALRYAEVGLTKGPDIQLGTGAEGSGVGIIVDNVPTGGVGKAAKRAVEEQPAAAPRRKAKITTMYVRRGVPAGKFPSRRLLRFPV